MTSFTPLNFVRGKPTRVKALLRCGQLAQHSGRQVTGRLGTLGDSSEEQPCHCS